MTQKLLFKLTGLSSDEFVRLLSKNGFDELSEIFTEKKVTFSTLKDLSELDARKWHLPKDKFLSLMFCIDRLNNRPESLKLFDLESPNCSQPPRLRTFASQNHIAMQRTLLEKSITFKPPELHEKSVHKVIKQPEYDSQGYLQPLSIDQQLYEPAPDLGANVYEQAPKERSPQTLPRAVSSCSLPLATNSLSRLKLQERKNKSDQNLYSLYEGETAHFVPPPRQNKIAKRPLPAVPKERIKLPASAPNLFIKDSVTAISSSTETIYNNTSYSENDSGNGTFSGNSLSNSIESIRNWSFIQKGDLPTPPVGIPRVEIQFPDEAFEEVEDDVNLNNFKFFRNTDRKGARRLLETYEDGAFLVRPSNQYHLTLSVKCHGKIFNLGIDKIAGKLLIKGDDDQQSQEFSNVEALVRHYETEPLTFQHRTQEVEVYLKPILPDHVF